MPTPWQKFAQSQTLVASPTAAAETIVCSLAVPTVDSPTCRIYLMGQLNVTYGTAATAARMRIRQTNVTGTVVGDTGAVTRGVAAGALDTLMIWAADQPGEVAGFVYVLTLQVTSASATSTVTLPMLVAIVSPN